MTNATYHNYSNYSFNITESKLFSYGLSFAPTVKMATIAQVNNAIAKLQRKCRTRWHMRNNPPTPNTNTKTYEPNPNYTPPVASAAIEEFIVNVSNDLVVASSVARNTRLRANYRKQELTAMLKVASNNNIVFSKADKNLGLTILDKTSVTAASTAELSKTSTYKRITYQQALDIAAEFIASVSSILRNYSSMFSASVTRFITKKFNSAVTLPAWYLLPKIHKLVMGWRPICPSFAWVTNETSAWLAAVLNPVANQLSTVCTSSMQLVRTIECTKIPANAELGSADVTALYPSIPIHLGLEYVKSTLEQHSSYSTLFIIIIIRMLKLVLTSNAFEHTGDCFLQIAGTAMGTPCAPPFANIFMYCLEHSSVQQWLYESKLFFFYRYIDDILFSCAAGLVISFMNLLNQLHGDIVFTYETGDSIVMLDLIFHKGARFNLENILDYEVYQKCINLYQYIPFFSDHPPAVKAGFIKGELIRYAGLSSALQPFLSTRTLFFQRLRARGYPSGMLIDIFKSVSYSSTHSKLLSSNSSSPATDTPIFINLPYSRSMAFANPNRILSRHYHLLQYANREAGKEIFPKPIVVYSKSRTVFDIIRACQKQHQV